MGKADVKFDFKEFEQKLAEYLDENAETIAKEIAADAKAHGPFKDKTGRLRKSIKAKKSKFEDGGWIVIMGGKGARQAWLIEFGREGAPAFPTLRPAKDRAIGLAKRLFGVK